MSRAALPKLRTCGFRMPDLPDPDRFARPSGGERLSIFLLWQAAYSELGFVPVWPHFDRASLPQAIAEYRRRERLAKTGS